MPTIKKLTLLERARACYRRLCPYATPDLPAIKSTTMQAYVEGAFVYERMLEREREIWHVLHNALNNELREYKSLLENINKMGSTMSDKDYARDVAESIFNFLKDGKRL